jgi:hypothetical protein
VNAVRRSSPARYALGLVVLLVAVGYGVRLWGPLNPAIAMSVSGSTSPDAGAAPSTHVTVWLSNNSHSAVTILRARVEQPTGHRNGTTTRLPRIVSTTVTPPGATRAGPLPAVLGPGQQTNVQLALRVPPCPAHPDPLAGTSYEVAVVVRTSSGRLKTVRSGPSGLISESADDCAHLAALPSPGVQPAHPAAARLDVAHAFRVVYSFGQPPAARRALIDVPAGLDAPSAAAASGPYATNVTSVSAKVDRIVFTRPTTAAVAYDLLVDGSQTFATRVGHARFVGGRWKVTRATVCADLALANVTCPRP